MPACAVNLSTFDPSCAALQSVAGVRDYFYFARRSDITAAPQTAGTVTALTTTNFYKFGGRKFQNSGKNDLAKSDIGKSRIKQSFVFRVYYRSQADRTAIEQLLLAEDLVIVSPNNDNLIEVYGLSLGLSPVTGTGGTGTKLEDDNTFLITLEGDEPKLPAIFNTVTTPTNEAADYLTNIAYLDALVGA